MIQASSTRVAAALALLMLYVGAVSVDRAAHRYLWYDELSALIVVEQGSSQGIRHALAAAADSQPPPFYLAARLAREIVPDEHVALRLPSILGLVATPPALFLFLRRRSGLAGAVVAALVPLVSSLFDFAVEARGYAMSVCCVAWALVAWQRVERSFGAPALGLLLGAAVAFNYHAVLALAPFAVAELVLTYRRRSARWRVWLALLGATVPLVAYWPLLAELRRYYGAHFWARAGSSQLLQTYHALLPAGRWWGLALALVAGAVLVSAVSRAWRGPVAAGDDAPGHEEAVVLGFLALPVLAHAGAMVLGTGMTPRYALPMMLGFSLAAGMLAEWLGTRAATAMAAVLLCVFALQQVEYWQAVRPPPASANRHPEVVALESALRAAGRPALPRVVASGLRYLPLAHYGASGADARLPASYLVDPEAAVSLIGTDSADRHLARLALIHRPLSVSAADTFLQRNPRFLMYAGSGGWEWLPQRLRQDGYRIVPVGSGGPGRTLYLVDQPTAPS